VCVKHMTTVPVRYSSSEREVRQEDLADRMELLFLQGQFLAVSI